MARRGEGEGEGGEEEAARRGLGRGGCCCRPREPCGSERSCAGPLRRPARGAPCANVA